MLLATQSLWKIFPSLTLEQRSLLPVFLPPGYCVPCFLLWGLSLIPAHSPRDMSWPLLPLQISAKEGPGSHLRAPALSLELAASKSHETGLL